MLGTKDGEGTYLNDMTPFSDSTPGSTFTSSSGSSENSGAFDFEKAEKIKAEYEDLTHVMRGDQEYLIPK